MRNWLMLIERRGIAGRKIEIASRLRVKALALSDG
jgi:hypothetical protein